MPLARISPEVTPAFVGEREPQRDLHVGVLGEAVVGLAQEGRLLLV